MSSIPQTHMRRAASPSFEQAVQSTPLKMEPNRVNSDPWQEEEPDHAHQRARCNPITLRFLQNQITALQQVIDKLTDDENYVEAIKVGQRREGTQAGGGRGKNASASRIKYVVSKVDTGTGIRGEMSGKPPEDSENENTGTQYAIEAKEVLAEGKTTSQITILATPLRQLMYSVLQRQLEHEKNTNWAEAEPSLNTMKEPFALLTMNWKELVAETERVEEEDGAKSQARLDLRDLLQHVRTLKPDLTMLCESIEIIKRVRFEHLFILFRPGTFVIATPFLGHPQQFKIHSQHMDKEQFVLRCWGYDWNGVKLIRKYYDFTIKEFDDEASIKELPCCPISHYEDKDFQGEISELRKKLILRGRKFRMICTKPPGAASLCGYRGMALKGKRDVDYRRAYINLKLGIGDPLKHQEITVKINENIMVDFESYKQDNESLPIGDLDPLRDFNSCHCSLCLDEVDLEWVNNFPQWRPEDESAMSNIQLTTPEGDLSDNNFLLLPPRVLGWAFKTGVFAQFLVDDVGKIEDFESDVGYNNRLFFPKDLEENKMDMKSLIMAHTSDNEKRTSKESNPILSDPIGGKGEGLVILLHGPPGVGKTLTVELVARAARKPLYKVGASDIGFEPGKAERELERLFHLASKWQAVLLIDEADVFLDSRGSKGEVDVRKNALVSVMLRVLEYFRGVLVMTTNRVLTLDAAMVSRIHYAINLPPLEKEQEDQIWTSYLTQLTSKNCAQIKEIEAWTKKLVKKAPSGLNGREIRNLFTAAQTLAKGEEGNNGKIHLEHLERIYETMQKFRKDMNRLLIEAKSETAKY